MLSFFDFHKAFDLVPLMANLNLLDEQISGWINNYLAKRHQMVAVNGAESSEAIIVIIYGTLRCPTGLRARTTAISHLHQFFTLCGSEPPL